MTDTDTRAPATRDAGFTLIEVLVALFLLGILGSIIATITIQATRSTHNVATRAAVQSDLADGVMRVSGSVRAALWFTDTSPTSLSMARPGPAGECTLVRYRITAGTLTSQTSPVCGNSPVWAPPQTIVTGLDPAVSPFLYYQAGSTTGATNLQPGKVQRVGVHLKSDGQALATSATAFFLDALPLCEANYGDGQGGYGVGQCK